MGPLLHVFRAPVLGRFGSFACWGRCGSRLVGCGRHFCPPPPTLVVVWPVVRPLFLPCPFRVRPLWARCVGVGVSPFFASLFFCVPRLMFWSGSLSLHHCHFHFMFAAGCVCTIWKDVKLLFSTAGGRGFSSRGLCQRSSTLDDQVNVPAYVYIYIYILSGPWAHMSQLGGDLYLIAVVLYCQWLL